MKTKPKDTKKAKHEYVVGFATDHDCLYGREKNNEGNWIDKMTLNQARRMERSLKKNSDRVAVAIYKLVPIKAEELEKKLE